MLISTPVCCHIESLHTLQLKAPASELSEVWELIVSYIIVLCMFLFLPSAVERADSNVPQFGSQSAINVFDKSSLLVYTDTSCMHQPERNK